MTMFHSDAPIMARCPLCGGPASRWPDGADADGRPVAPWFAGCQMCQTAACGLTADEATSVWNQRASSASEPAPELRCPFDDPKFAMDPAAPCPVCGELGIGTWSVPIRCVALRRANWPDA